MRKYFYPLVAVAALAILSLGAEKANAQYVTYSSGYYAPSYDYVYAPAYSYGYAPAYYPNTAYYAPSYGYYQPSGVSVSIGTGYYGSGYGYGGYPGYYGGYGGYGRYSGYSVGVGPVAYSNYRYSGGGCRRPETGR